MPEPYFMQQLHRQREREARIFWGRFKGDFNKYQQWAKDELNKSLRKQGYCLEWNKNGRGFLVRDKGKSYKAGKLYSFKAIKLGKKSQEEKSSVFQPKYTISSKILNNLLEIERLKMRIDKARILPLEELKLKRDAVITMIHHSTGIEGNTLSKYEVGQVLQGKKVSADKREIYEVENYKKALDYISLAIEKKRTITSAAILQIHKCLTNNILDIKNCGKFRTEPVYVVSRSFGKATKILYTGPNAQIVPQLIRELTEWLTQIEKNDLSPIVIAGIAHAELAAIHPFIDGNGRTARLIATMLLYERGYDFRKLFALEEYYNQDRQKYYHAIYLGDTYEERKKADMTNWLEYFVQGFKVSMQEVWDKIEPLQSVKIGEKEQAIYLIKNERLVLDFLLNQGKIYRQDVEEITNLSESSALRLLERLGKQGLISQQGAGRNVWYALKE